MKSENCPFRYEAFQDTENKKNIPVCLLHHVKGMSCENVKNVDACPLERRDAKEILLRYKEQRYGKRLDVYG